jgi:hypothetical protein
MTRREQLPEEATEEPRILSPEEQGARALKRLELAGDIRDPDRALSLGDPDSPLRMPGELSPKPRPSPYDLRTPEVSREAEDEGEGEDSAADADDDDEP